MRLTALRAAALFAVALAARLLAAGASGLYVDEAFGFFLSRGDFAQLAASARPDNNPPLWYFILHPIAVATRNAFLLRLPSCLLGALAAPVTYLAGRLLGERVGLTSGTMVALSFACWSVDAQTRAYGLVALLAAVALWAALDTGRNGAPHLPWPALALTAAALPLLHLVGWLVDVALLAASLVPGTPRRAMRAACYACGVVAGAAWMGYAAAGGRSALHGYAHASGLGEAPLLFAYLAGLPLPLHWTGIRPVPMTETATWIISGIVATAALYGVAAAAGKHRRQASVLALFVLVPFAGIVAGGGLGLQTYQNRYLVPVSSGLFILLAAAAFGPRDKRPAGQAWAALAMAVLGVNLTTLALYPSDRFLHNQDWVSAAAWIEGRELPGDAIVACIPYSVVGLDFYYHAGQVDVDFSRNAVMQLRFRDDYNGADQFAIMPSMLDTALAERLRGRRVFVVFNQADPGVRQQVLAWFSDGWRAADELVLQGLVGWAEITVLELTPRPAPR